AMLASVARSKAFNDSQANDIIEKLNPYINIYKNNITGDAAKGDEVVFIEAKYTGSYKNAKFVGFDVVEGKIINESYGEDKQQHTFTLELNDGSKKKIKGRNLYKYGLFSKPRNYNERAAALDEKHGRGSAARKIRNERLMGDVFET
ncbi:MAG: hypothetical protein RR508_08750, partial [Oscillospiraceae bacterium]